MNRVTGDHMGMLATVINALAIGDACKEYFYADNIKLMMILPCVSVIINPLSDIKFYGKNQHTRC
jgi:uridylate kinase